MGIDWGGGGDDSKSSTTISVCCLQNNDTVHVLYMERLPLSMSIQDQISRILYLIKRFEPKLVAHDYNGEGASREVLLTQAGVALNRIVPFSYGVAASKNIITYEANKSGYRKSYFIDKPRSLVVMAHMIKGKKILFPSYASMSLDTEAVETSSDNLMSDFLNLVEERRDNPRGSDIVLVSKIAETFDDFAHSTNFAASALWYTQGAYPNVAEALQMELDVKTVAKLFPKNPDWS